MHTHATSDSTHSSHDHGDPFRIYMAVFFALMVLLLLTYGAYFIPCEKWNIGEYNMGWVNTAIALTIATVKTMLVVLVFMHLRHSTRLTWVTAACGFIFLSIMVLFTFADYLSRNHISESIREAQVDVQAGTHANGQVLEQEHLPNQVRTADW